MSESPKEVAESWFEHVWNRGDESAVDRLLVPDARFHGLGPAAMSPADFKRLHRDFRSAFPDIRIEVVRSVGEGEYVAVHCHMTGTHRGAGLGCAPTQRPVDIWGMGIARIHDGRIVEAWNCFDFLSLYQQCGMLPQLAPSAPAHGQSGE
jgi:predicted ester cyclase